MIYSRALLPFFTLFLSSTTFAHSDDPRIIYGSMGLTVLAMVISFLVTLKKPLFLRIIITLAVGVPFFFMSLMLTYGFFDSMLK